MCEFELDTEILVQFATINDEELASLKNDIRKIFKSIGIILDDIKLTIDTEFHGDFLVDVLNADDTDKYFMRVLKTGKVLYIEKLDKVDIDSIRKNCILKKCPIILNEYVIDYNEEKVLCCNGNPVKFVDLFNGNGHKQYDNWFRMNEYDTGEMLAFIANKYDWGMNLSVCMYDYKTNTIYVCGSYNFDYPEGIALKYENSKLYIFLDNESTCKTLLYKKEQIGDDEMRLDLLNIYRETGWSPFKLKRLYDVVPELIHLYDKYDMITPKNLSNLVEEYPASLIREKKYDDCITFLCDLSNYTKIGELILFSDYVKNVIKYNLVCCFALKNDKENALGLMDELFRNKAECFEHLLDDDDLCNLHETEAFKEYVRLCNESEEDEEGM